MPRIPIIVGNWKMNKTPAESLEFVRELAPKIEALDAVERVVAPTFLSLPTVAEALEGSAVQVAAQDAHWQADGAYTSQVSASMLADFVDYIIIGHSECRAYLNETDQQVNKKAKAILANGLKPIIAVGVCGKDNDILTRAGQFSILGKYRPCIGV